MTRDEAEAVILAFPETVIGTSHGRPSCKAFGTFFTDLRREGDDPEGVISVLVGCVDRDRRDMLCAAEPETFHVTPHFIRHDWVLARIARLDAARLQHLLAPRWRKNAPRRWLKDWDAGRPG